MASSANPDNSGSTWSCDSSEVVTRLFKPNGDVAPTEYDSFALTEAEVAAILIKEK
jgi:hypothetical protein